ncbi:ABC transporter permease [Hymenobacter sp. CRA2]|uniref:ABC transporter permease n=1 Tax=Hymenobacter sp. CRA2 TaxID=1955620 RepID=UPI00098FBAB0|nr:ABC transporter permease [Hymenobacter sp. CRA2]OON70467.1 hypothetical protein B0919_00075 [Hymenobacter sp. CRA2]
MNTALLAPTPGPLTQLRRSLAADTLKLKHTAALWLALGSGALPVVLYLLIFYFKGQYLVKAGQNPWPSYISHSWQTTAGLLLPLFVVLLCSLVLHVETKASAWKHLDAQPVGHLATYVSKLLVLLGLNLLAQVVFVVLLLASGALLGLLRPGLLFSDYAPPVAAMLTLLGHTYLATLGILALQFVAALWWRNFVTPVAIGMGCTVVGLALLRWEYIDWVPYAEPLLATSKAMVKGKANTLTVAQVFNQTEQLAVGWWVVVLTVAYPLLRWRQQRQ